MRKNDTCKNLNFEDCELAILRQAVDNAEEKQGKIAANSPEVKRIIGIVENYIRQKQLICYGGTAINNILPKQDQFYNTDVEIPDYDFYSSNALTNAKELVDTYIKEGFVEVEAKSGQHHGTYKVYVNFIPVADITFLDKELFNALKKESIRVSGILYASPNYLRMSMYLELSRPEGDKSRWEKVLKRLILLNKYYPLTGAECSNFKFQRKMEKKFSNQEINTIYDNVKNTLVDQGVVFFGGYALSLYSKYMPFEHIPIVKVPDFDVLSEDPETTAEIVKERLEDNGFKNIKIIKQDKIGEIVAPHYMINIGTDTLAFIYKPLACHSYNITNEHGLQIKVATIDTMLSFYLAFIYSGRPYYDINRILCMAHYLFRIQQKNRLEQKGLLKRFSIDCYGHQETIEEMRAAKSEKYKELKNKRDTLEYEEYFLRYRPADNMNTTASTRATKESSKSLSSKSLSSKSLSSKSLSSSSKSFKKRKQKRKKTKKTKKKGFFF